MEKTRNRAFRSENFKGKGDLEDLDVDDRIILKRILQKQDERVWLAGLI
jgi:hypothetical protein